jgi:hypothetical protein
VSRLAIAGLATTLLAGCVSAPAPAQITLKAPPPPAETGGSRPPPATSPTPEPIDPAEVAVLEKTIRGLLLANMPEPLVQSAPGWGAQKEVTVGGRLKGMPVKELKNDGTWRRLSVIAHNPGQSLAVRLRDAVYPAPGRATFTALIGLDLDLRFEQQLWQNGLRLYSGETRGRCRAGLLLKCEILSRTEKKPGSLLPDVIVRGRATEAHLFYQDLVIEHTAGIGGDGARLLGDAAINTVKQVKPDLERDLLAKADAAIVKAADTKEVRLSFDSIVKGQVPGIPRSK